MARLGTTLRGKTRAALLLVLVLLCIGQVGCVRRRLTIRSNPPGALVYIDNQEIGYTPVSTSFVYYGTRKIELIKDGYETVTVLRTIPAPWYEMPPVDFVSENVWPGDIRDERVLDFQLIPQQLVSSEQLIDRAEHLRSGSQRGILNPLPNQNFAPQVLPPPQPQPQTYPSRRGGF